MVLVQVQNIQTASVLLASASKLAGQLKKAFGILYLIDMDEQYAQAEIALDNLLDGLELADFQCFIRKSKPGSIPEICEELDISFLFIQLPGFSKRMVKHALFVCRELRIPYVLFKDDYAPLQLDKVILPVGFLEEELEKAQFAAAFGRFCGSEIKMLLANDYGSKAATNAGKMKDLFDLFDFKYTLDKAAKDSFRVEMEAVDMADYERAGLAIVSASRDYGLDDMLFGPKEFHVIKRSRVPVLLVNPRGDLYALCD